MEIQLVFGLSKAQTLNKLYFLQGPHRLSNQNLQVQGFVHDQTRTMRTFFNVL